ncbi:hypothetical protein [Brachybacterium massiliense]|uniref:hypothetical protein n=1 Tax=Brachybacterium massiliense TaxID=1755098 RepID=UPI000B3BD08F|nr:hypothetical protein [Brachybacterium massiliense]
MFFEFQGLRVGGRDLPLIIEEYESTLGNLRTGDAERPLTGGHRPGRDFQDSGELTFTLITGPSVRGYSTTVDTVEGALAAWRGTLDAPAGVMFPLVVEWGDGRRRVYYGRPGRSSSPDFDRYADQGHMTLVLQFRVLDPFVYDTIPTGATISVVPRSLGGIIAPIVTPVTTTMTSGVEYRMLTVGGDAPAPLRVTFHGPARDPRVTVGGVEVGVVGEIAYDENVIVDGRTRSVHLDDAAQTPAGHRLSRGSRLDLLRVEPGVHEVAFTATDRTGTARVTVEATPAYYHL